MIDGFTYGKVEHLRRSPLDRERFLAAHADELTWQQIVSLRDPPTSDELIEATCSYRDYWRSPGPGSFKNRAERNAYVASRQPGLEELYREYVTAGGHLTREDLSTVCGSIRHAPAPTP